MKILCEYTPAGPHYVRSGWGHAFKTAGHDFRFWVRENKSAFDAFSEFEPDLFIGTTYGIDRSLEKCIATRPNLRVGLFASAWGPYIDHVDLNEYPIVVATEQEKRTIEALKKSTGRPDFVFIHVTYNYLNPTMGGWKEIGVEPHGILNAADICIYHPAPAKDELKCDVAFVGGYWGYKSKNLNSHILPLCHPDSGINVKIFGNSRWPTHRYLGNISDAAVKHLFNSATVCPNVSEPHSTDLGWDIIERPFKVLAAGGFCVSDFVKEAVEEQCDTGKPIFTGDEIPFCWNQQEFNDVVWHFITHPEDRLPFIKAGQRKVLTSHTYHDRVIQMLTILGMTDEAAGVAKAKEGVIDAFFPSVDIDDSGATTPGAARGDTDSKAECGSGSD